jgi:glycosyltransferase involved in cell wall biosynthesis
MKEFSIIIPVFNSASCLQETVQKVIVAVEKLQKEYEIILVDDGSRDNSWQIIKQLKSTNQHIIGIKLSKNFGQHNALLCGLKACSGNYIITLDDDLEQQPEDISKLYDKLVTGNFDLVYGMPVNSQKSILRAFLTFVYKRTIRTENKNAGEGSSFRILTKKLRDDVITHSGSLFFMDEIVLWYTDNLGYEKVTFNKSKKTNSGYGYSTLFMLSLKVLSLGSTLPLRFVRVLGFNICALSILTGIYFIIRKIVLHKVPMGYTSLMVVLLFSTGIITFSLGIIGEYIGNLIALSNNKPPYSVKEKV